MLLPSDVKQKIHDILLINMNASFNNMSNQNIGMLLIFYKHSIYENDWKCFQATLKAKACLL